MLWKWLADAYALQLEERAQKALRYLPDDTMIARLENDYIYHAPKDGQPERYQAIREKTKELALLIVQLTPPSREQSLALTHVEEASMLANAAIARNE